MELPGVPYRISHEEHPYSYALNIFDDIVDGADDDDINDDNDTANDQAPKLELVRLNDHDKKQGPSCFRSTAIGLHARVFMTT